MDFKKMLMEMAEAQAEKMREEAMTQIESEEFSDMLATKLNEKIDIPFVSEAKEQEFFEKAMDLLTDILGGFFKEK
tara:strand:+ start:583 stop:810 length:228 start_codon:yes stop_codon:yes gene_type:complete